MGVAVIATSSAMAQDLKSKDVPQAVKSALVSKYPEATKVSWEKEKVTTKPIEAVNQARITP